MKKVILLAVLLIISNVFWFVMYAYTLIDQGVTNSYQADSYQYMAQQIEGAVFIANENLVGKSVSEAKGIAIKHGLEKSILLKEGCLYIHELCMSVNRDNIITGVMLDLDHK